VTAILVLTSSPLTAPDWVVLGVDRGENVCLPLTVVDMGVKLGFGRLGICIPLHALGISSSHGDRPVVGTTTVTIYRDPTSIRVFHTGANQWLSARRELKDGKSLGF